MSIYEITVNGHKFVVELGEVTGSPVEVVVNGERKTVAFSEATAPAPAAPSAPAPVAEAPAAKPAAPFTGEGQPIKAPMPGKILSVAAKVGAQVKEGDTVLTFEAMKMEMPLSSTVTGTVKAINVSVGDTVAYDDTLMVIG
ncbi:MAG: acetyl-CoA carboxylase biotin carboxyl carrier protein subunit [Chloroflexi bacterium]|nr:acetyl-CoA carboxylase biotin carboxyl carrier protein subunit [Chloroflexota bacterium]